MSAPAATPRTSTPSFVSSAAGRGAVNFPGVVRAEWIKLRSLRSTTGTLLAAGVVLVGFGLVVTSVTASRWPRMSLRDRLTFSPVDTSLDGFYLAQLAVGVLGVLVVTGEYSTGSVRSTLAAVPRRLPVLWAKVLVFAACTFVVTGVAAVIAFLAGQAVLSGRHVGTSLSADGVARVVLGVPLYLTAVGVLAVALGALVRNTAGGIASVFGLVLVLPGLARTLPSSWQSHLVPYLPSEAGQSLARAHHESGMLAPWAGYAVLWGYVVVAVVASAVLLRRRDA